MEKLEFKRTYAYGLTKLTTYGHMTYVPNKYDEAVDRFRHLRESEDYRTLHIFHAQRIGVDKYQQLASLAEQEGKSPGRYFTWLLKREPSNA